MLCDLRFAAGFEVVMDARAIEWIKKAAFEVGIYHGKHENFWPCRSVECVE